MISDDMRMTDKALQAKLSRERKAYAKAKRALKQADARLGRTLYKIDKRKLAKEEAARTAVDLAGRNGPLFELQGTQYVLTMTSSLLSQGDRFTVRRVGARHTTFWFDVQPSGAICVVGLPDDVRDVPREVAVDVLTRAAALKGMHGRYLYAYSALRNMQALDASSAPG